MEACADLFCLYPRCNHVRGLTAPCGKTSRPVWTFLDFAHGKHFGKPEFPAFCIYVQSLLSLFFLRRGRRHWPWVRLGDGCPGHGQVVPRQGGPGDRIGVCGIRWRFGNFRLLRKFSVISSLWLAKFLRDSRRNISCYDDDSGFFAEEPSSRPSHDGWTFLSQHANLPPPIHSGRGLKHSGILPAVAWLWTWIDRGAHGHQPVDSL